MQTVLTNIEHNENCTLDETEHRQPSPVLADVGPSDAQLIADVRKGKRESFGVLYRRHIGSAYNLARQLAPNQADREELVSTAYLKVLDTLLAGNGPDSAFRAYLLTVLRHTAYDKTRRDRKIELADDVSEVSGVRPEAVICPFTDTAVAKLDNSLAAKAFMMLTERWQKVLWYTEIEGMTPAEVAPILGLTSNGVSALAYRAREGLKQAYLQAHVHDDSTNGCEHAMALMGAGARDGLSKRDKAKFTAHVDDCDDCREWYGYVNELNFQLW